MSQGIWNATFWKATAERALSTFLQAGLAAVSVVGAAQGLTDIDWLTVLDIAALAGGLSIVKNMITGLATDGNPSIGSAETLGAAPRRAITADNVADEDNEDIKAINAYFGEN